MLTCWDASKTARAQSCTGRVTSASALRLFMIAPLVDISMMSAGSERSTKQFSAGVAGVAKRSRPGTVNAQLSILRVKKNVPTKWAIPRHLACLQERKRVVEQFQALADRKNMRVTFLCSGTGAAGVAQFYRCRPASVWGQPSLAPQRLAL